MTFRDAVQLNRDCIDFMQQGFDQSAIDAYAAGWATLNFTMPNGLQGEIPAEELAELAAQRQRAARVIPPANVDQGAVAAAGPRAAAVPVAAVAAAPVAAAPMRRSASMPSLRGSAVAVAGAAADVAVRPPAPAQPAAGATAVAQATMANVAILLPLLIEAHPVFIVRSVPTEDAMSALPWHVHRNTRLDDVVLCGSNYFTIYNRAFEFDPINQNVEHTALGWLRCASNIPMVLHYNTGLAHHRLALLTNDPVHFVLALTNYHLGHQFLANQAASHQMDHELDLVVMALYNNMGHCFAYLDDDSSAMICFDHMLITLATTTRRNRLNQQEHEFYTDRIRLGMVKKSQPAAAA